MLMLRTFWRHTAKRYFQYGRRWSERRRYPTIFTCLESAEKAGLRIESALQDGRPFCSARMGHVEARLLGEWAFRQGRWSRATRLEAHANAGIFPVNDAALETFAIIYQQALQDVDLLGFWQTDYQAALVDQLLPRPALCSLSSLEPFRQFCPWSMGLANRSVLVVHPFANSIQAQYHENRSRLFKDERVLPHFELQVLHPPLTHAPNTEGFESWQAAFHHLEEQVLGRYFDVALLGCGAYGLPLAASVRRAGRQAIHMGGALQLLFGICGRRWDADPQIQTLITPAWTRPSPDETPNIALGIEGGCYW